MRPKIFTVLAVASLTLVGCSSADPDPLPTATVTTTPEAEQAPEAQPSADPDELFLEAAQQNIAQHADYFEAELPEQLLTDEALLERGADLCEQFEAGEMEAAVTGLPDAETELVMVVRGSAIAILCPPN